MSRWFVGSSSSSRSGSAASVLASEARVSSPPEKVSRRSPSWGRSAISASDRRSRSSSATRSAQPASTYSRRLRFRSRGGRWSCSATRAPFSKASPPPSTEVSPDSIRSRGVLPAPLRPASVIRSPRSSLNDTPRKSGAPAMSLSSPAAITTAMSPSMVGGLGLWLKQDPPPAELDEPRQGLLVGAGDARVGPQSPERLGLVPGQLAGVSDAPHGEHVGLVARQAVEVGDEPALEPAPYAALDVAQELVDALEVAVLRSALRGLDTALLARRYYRQGQVVVDVSVHPGERELDRTAPGVFADREEREPGVGTGAAPGPFVVGGEVEVREDHVEARQEVGVLEGRTAVDVFVHGLRHGQVEAVEVAHAVRAGKRGLDRLHPRDDTVDVRGRL